MKEPTLRIGSFFLILAGKSVTSKVMKLLKHLAILCILAAVAAGCGKQVPASLNLLTSVLNIPSEGGSEEVSIMTNHDWSATSSQPWLRVVPSSGSGSDSYQVLVVSAAENLEENSRKAEVTVNAGELTRIISVTQAGTPRFTIRDFRAKPVSPNVWYKLTGEIASIADDNYGNFYIFDDTDFVYVYGLCEKQITPNDKSFSKLGLKVGDVVTMMTLRSEYKGMIEAGGTAPAYFVSKQSGSYKLGKKVSSSNAGWLELPSTLASDGQDLLIHSFPDGSRNYAAYWDYTNLVASWVAYPLCAENIGNSSGRTEAFSVDPLLPRDKQPFLLSSSFSGGNVTGSFDRGHQIPSADRNETRVNMETFFGTNMTPQDHVFNGGIWETLEKKVRNWAKNSTTDTLYVVTGCYGVDVTKRYTLDNDNKHVAIPEGYYKALLRLSKDKQFSALGIWFNNESKTGSSITKDMVISIDDLEKKVGVDFFVNLPKDVEKTVEAANPAEEPWWWNN